MPLPEFISDRMAEAINQDKDFEDAAASGDIVTVTENDGPRIWELAYHGDPKKLLQLTWFHGVMTQEQAEKLSLFAESWGLELLEPWVARGHGWYARTKPKA